MNVRRIQFLGLPLGACHVALAGGGCATAPSGQGRATPRYVTGAPEGQIVTSAELDELTRAFADRYVGLLYSVCEAIKNDNPDAAQRREAQLRVTRRHSPPDAILRSPALQ